MKETTILCGMRDRDAAVSFMKSVEHQLMSRGVYIAAFDMDKLVIRTKHTRTAFIYNVYEQPLDGVEADALFGIEPFKKPLWQYLKPGRAYNVGMGLVDYIVYQEDYVKARTGFDRACGEYEKRLYISTAGTCRDEFMRQWTKYNDESVEYLTNDVKYTQMAYGLLSKINCRTALPDIKDVIFNNPATIIFWADGTKTVVQCQDGEPYDPEKGLAMAMCKKMYGNKRDYYHTFQHWLKKGE